MHEQRFLLITSFLVALIGAPAVYSVVKEPQSLESLAKKQTSTSQDRSPASVKPIVSESSQKNAIKSRSVVLDYSCAHEKSSKEVDGTLLRLRGKGCKNSQWKNVSVVNQTNGFTATVVVLKDNQFTTDYIDLQEGDNQIAIKGTDENGKSVNRTFVVKRRFPASTEN